MTEVDTVHVCINAGHTGSRSPDATIPTEVSESLGSYVNVASEYLVVQECRGDVSHTNTKNVSVILGRVQYRISLHENNDCAFHRLHVSDTCPHRSDRPQSNNTCCAFVHSLNKMVSA